MKRRSFLKRAAALPALGAAGQFTAQGHSQEATASPHGRYTPGRIPNEYNLFLPGERDALQDSPRVASFQAGAVTARLGTETKTLKTSDSIGGWQLVAVLPWENGAPTAVFEKHVTHQGAIAYLTERGEIARIPKRIGDLSKIRPRPTRTPHGVKLERPASRGGGIPGPDVCGDYILNSDEDPCYENVAALGAELIGWTLVANEEAGPEKSLWLEADGKSRQLPLDTQSLWAPDLTGRLFEPQRFLPSEYLYEYVPGYSKRTLLAGYLPVADIGVWNPNFKVGYEVMVLLPPGPDAKPVGRIRAMVSPGAKGTLIPAGDTNATLAIPGAGFVERYWNGSAENFFLE